ncbi:hypothetical protein V2I01_39365 [Micromonospora sp. BRA006-A]|nr:hypothetical protein [Micromonospora sp. BRA006-A]
MWGELKDVDDLTLDSVWVEHTVCAYWGVSVDGLTIRDSRFRNTFADAVNMTNGSTNNLVTNSEGRSRRRRVRAVLRHRPGRLRRQPRQRVREPDRHAHLAGGGAGGVRRLRQRVPQPVHRRPAHVLGHHDQLAGLRLPVRRVRRQPAHPVREHLADPVRRALLGGQTFPAMWLFSASKEFRGIRVTDVDIVDPTYSGIMFQTKYNGSQPENPITDTVLTNVSISGARRSGDAFDAKSGFGIWVNEMPEAGQGPAVGAATSPTSA